jgi:hypothetical protein
VHLWILLSRIPHSPSQTLANGIFQNVGVAFPSRRRLFLNGIWEQELDKVHPTVQNLATLWNFARNALLKVFRSTLSDTRTDSMYAVVYTSLYVLCNRSSGMVGAPGLPSVQRLGHLTAPPSTPQSRSQGPADDEEYVPPNDESESRDLGMEKAHLGKRSQREDTVYLVVPTAPMKKRRESFSSGATPAQL